MTSALGTKVWLNGGIMDADEAHVGVTDRGLTLGDGLFETMLWTGEKIRFLDNHLARLRVSARAFSIKLPATIDQIKEGLAQLTTPAQGQTAALRLTLTRGAGPRGLALPDTQNPQLLATIAAYCPPTTPVSLASVTIERNATSPTARYKTLSYFDNVMALRQARAIGADDAIMRGSTGAIACASSANIVIHYRGQTLTPAIDDGALPGIVRGRLIKAGLIAEAHITPHMLANCTHGALTNALIGVRSVEMIDSRRLERGSLWLEMLHEGL